jgi:hypothetical protein
LKNWTCEERWSFFSALRFFRHVFSLIGVGAAILLMFKYAVISFGIGALIGVLEHILMVKYKDCLFGPPSVEQTNSTQYRSIPRLYDDSKRYKPLISDKD